jgi:Txe/YoeB family toxin of Txe-Axe toxin-antitoxin module
MKVKPVKESIDLYLKRHHLERKFKKATDLFEQNMKHPSLNVELLEPKHLRVYSFRVDRKYRAIFILAGKEIEIIAVTNHYK